MTKNQKDDDSPMFSSRRRQLVLSALTVAGLMACSTKHEVARPAIASAAPFVKPSSKWTGNDILAFLLRLPKDDLAALKSSLGILAEEQKTFLQKLQKKLMPTASAIHQISDDLGKVSRQNQLLTHLKGAPTDQNEILQEICEVSSFFRRCPDPTAFNYHDIVTSAAKDFDIDSVWVNTATTYEIERRIANVVMIHMGKEFDSRWDAMSNAERTKALERADPDGMIRDKAAITVLNGSAARLALIAAINVYGFSFYTALTTTMASLASVVGLTIPMSAYLSATSFIGIMAGPIGWATAIVGSVLSLIYFGRPDSQKALAFIMQIHSLKMQALYAAGLPDPYKLVR